MKKKNKALLAAIFAVTLILALFIPTFAATDKYGRVIWNVSDDGEVLTGEKTYYKIKIPDGYKVYIHDIYRYRNPVENGDVRLSNIETNENGKNIIEANYHQYYVDSELRTYLNHFFRFSEVKDVASYIVFDGYLDEDKSLLKELDNLNTLSYNLPVRELESLGYIDITAYDYTTCVYSKIGRIYIINSYAYYIDFTILPNNYFDSYGNFSYRGDGSVPSRQLSNSAVGHLNELRSDGNEVDFEYSYNSEPSDFEVKFGNLEGLGGVVLIFAFYAILVFVGIVMPIIPMALGLILPHFRKLGKPRGWYGLAVSCALWIVFGIVLIITITVLMVVGMARLNANPL